MTHFSDVIPQLNAASQEPGQLLNKLREVFNQRADWASALIPSYAAHLARTDFDALAAEYPALSPLLNGYRQLSA